MSEYRNSQFASARVTRLATVAAAVAMGALSGCASQMDPAMKAGTAMAYGIVYASTEVAITAGRTITDALGVGVETIPRGTPPPYGAVLPRPVP